MYGKSVGKQISRGLVRFFDEYFVVGCSVLVCLVQRRTLVFVRVQRNI